MKKDIEIPVSKDVHVAIAREWTEDFTSKDWNVYVLNNKREPIEMVLVVSKGYLDDKKTSTMRHAIGVVAAKSFEKVELIQEEVLALNNEFFITYYLNNKIYERRFLFEANTVSEKNLVRIALLDKEGVLAT